MFPFKLEGGKSKGQRFKPKRKTKINFLFYRKIKYNSSKKPGFSFPKRATNGPVGSSLPLMPTYKKASPGRTMVPGSADPPLESGLAPRPPGRGRAAPMSELPWGEGSEALRLGSQLAMESPRSRGRGLGSTSWPSVSSSLKWERC